jgi:hypothetical protein
MVRKVWKMFAEEIFPLVRSLSTPQRLLDAVEQGEDAVKAELERVKNMALGWLTAYVRVYGACVTPYVHVLGRHLHHMLSRDGGYTIGTWSQQGFEACHKLVRKIHTRKTAHGGGKATLDGEPLSPLLQVLQHVYRTKWGMMRNAVTNPPVAVDPNNPLYSVVVHDLAERFDEVDEDFAQKYPDRDIKAYVTKSCKSALTTAWKKHAAMSEEEENAEEE